MHSYSYCVLRYLHDPSSGEAINVGVLVYAPEDSFVRLRFEHRTKALAGLFGGFSRDDFTRFLFRLEASVERFQNALRQSQGGLFEMRERPADAAVVAKWLLADNGLSFQFGPSRGGVTRDLLAATHTVFERAVLSQRPAPVERKRRDEEAVWSTFQSAFREHGIGKVLSAHTVETPDFELPFDHAFQNERWHAIEPLSFDYARPDDIRDRAALWYSYGVALSQSEEFAQLYLLLGAPTNPDHLAAYGRAKNWLRKMPGEPVLVEEKDAASFAKRLASEMKQHGVLPGDAEELPS
jgi:hypothetical protein